ncbi:MAG: DUF4292 domain-containing protein [Bacteroidia bacterium]|nr:DUF4292 domain-containing protein [Bacteroidia bacterium]
MRKGLYLLIVLLVLVGCKSVKQVATPVPLFLSSKVQLAIPQGDNLLTIGGTMKLKTHQCVQISLLMPLIRSEVARIEITPDEVLLVDRMNKRYVRARRSEIEAAVSKKVEFSRLEKLLVDASLPGGKREMTGKELGIPSLEKAKLKLYDFTDRSITITPTELSSRYTQVSLEELMTMLTKIL